MQRWIDRQIWKYIVMYLDMEIDRHIPPASVCMRPGFACLWSEGRWRGREMYICIYIYIYM